MNGKTRSYLTKEIKEAIAKRNKMKKYVNANNREEYQKACSDTKEMITDEKSKRWKEYVSKLVATTSSAQGWGHNKNTVILSKEPVPPQ